ncbi:MAG: glycoside hydrolase family 30 beta sandwich domain-containing protein [Lachnospiraceae bacterium]|nr:glycoside hydrolase family 30 beta sandwich domain-containing protein [Lachnospiraceae bacterium]MDD3616786.1 glycoside hydrolase family 30 beta sandwich domain-containing protein [Lachnospiraceae bacterium]
MKLELFTTTYEENKKKVVKQEISFESDTERENELINLYPHMQYQAMEGFGGAITDSAGYVYSLMNKEQKTKMIEQYFGRENMKYRFVRIPIDSCDFSLEHYEACSEETDDTFAEFSFERVERYIIPLLDAAEAEYGAKLDIMLSPWSPPTYMKTNGERNNGGKLKKEYEKRWAEYICRYIEEYRNRGYHVTKLTLQNEPKAVQTWDSCVYTAAEQKTFLRDYMWPSLQAHHLTDIEIYLWDHNKERALEWAEEIIDDETDKMVAGIAFHWYSGDHFESLRMIRERFPEKKLLLSEACIEYSKFEADDYLKNAQKYGHDMIGNLNEGMSTFLDWNLILDDVGGPNHVKNFCDAPMLFHTEEKQLKETNILGYLWHFSHFIESGAVRIGVSRYTDKLEVTAFKNQNNMVFVVLNRTEEEIPAYIRMNGKCAKLTISPLSISTGVVE